jgi:hypothetical protein
MCDVGLNREDRLLHLVADRWLNVRFRDVLKAGSTGPETDFGDRVLGVEGKREETQGRLAK